MNNNIKQNTRKAQEVTSYNKKKENTTNPTNLNYLCGQKNKNIKEPKNQILLVSEKQTKL